jgi:hypothetical protein
MTGANMNRCMFVGLMAGVGVLLDLKRLAQNQGFD